MPKNCLLRPTQKRIAFRAAKCMSDLDRHEDLLNFLSRNVGLVNSSVNLRSIWAWTLFHEGRFDDARNVLETLKEYANSSSTSRPSR